MNEEKGNWENIEGVVFWQPSQKGEVVEGKISNMTTGDYGLQATITASADTELSTVIESESQIVRIKKGDRIRTPSHKVLQSRLCEAKEGDMIRITYSGEEEGKTGHKPTKIYKVQKRKD